MSLFKNQYKYKNVRQKLNDFIYDANQKGYLTDTKESYRSKKNLKPVGKTLDWESTKTNWIEQLYLDCKDSDETEEKCIIQTLNYDLPEFCLFGNRCFKKYLIADLENKYTNLETKEDIPDDYFENIDIQPIDDLENIEIDEDIF